MFREASLRVAVNTPPLSLHRSPEAPSEYKDNINTVPGALSPPKKESNGVKIHKKKTKSPTPVHQNNKVQPPTPPPLPPTPITQPLKPLIVKNRNVSVPKDAHNRLKKELTDQVTLGHNAHRKWGKVNLNHWDGLYITAESSPAEVQEWMESKDFSPEIRNLFRDMTGKMMYKFTRSRLEEVLGNEEGGRLHSHLTVQKNISGYKTYSSRELQTILAERRRKIENSTDSTITQSEGMVKLFNGSSHSSDSGISSNGSDSDLSNTGSDQEAKITTPSRENKEKQKATYEWQRRQLLAQAMSN
ncbi:epidermal growth factor receptor kinase substrate 8-like [Limulus polyphemus]|uniref:Epidermal growth factor receptor kinase substrate 8-like n=1 Tax=Limulus polyphemus TaxID=6850 RepID=A0ABM1SIR3_LIMPO|nr:epidermal growth factor receptor kinase substrate 8-like [Limulus polyphemus]